MRINSIQFNEIPKTSFQQNEKQQNNLTQNKNLSVLPAKPIVLSPNIPVSYKKQALLN